jgi:hypothetical protein
MHGSEEQSEGRTMEVDSIVAPELQPIKLEVVSSTRVFSDATDGFGEIKRTTLVLAHMPTEIMVFFGETVDQAFFDTIIKDDRANLKVEFSMEEETLIPIQPESIATPIATISLVEISQNATILFATICDY